MARVHKLSEPQCYCKTQQHTFNISFEEGGGYCQNGHIDPSDPKGQLIQFSNVIIIEWKFYAQGTVAVIEETHESPFLVMRLSKRMVDKVEVFKLQIESLSWLKLDRLGDRTLCLGINCCMSVPASTVGSRNN
ncbi:hypothetical protein HAX54_035106 [Datura stramonium]|uniref:KIB1-4 beta-propeller domain-containing protein n=1 Tax=Datura stramonium TaxID=4076 RepID=A0ABS8SF39_DATST|nr:hypothetical protein [Datura stramonium]